MKKIWFDILRASEVWYFHNLAYWGRYNARYNCRECNSPIWRTFKFGKAMEKGMLARGDDFANAQKCWIG